VGTVAPDEPASPYLLDLVRCAIAAFDRRDHLRILFAEADEFAGAFDPASQFVQPLF